MWEGFTEAARQSIVLAQDEAQRLGDRDIHTRHLLLGILAEATSVAARALKNSGVTLDAARAQADKNARSAVAEGEAIFTPRSKRIIELAFEQARVFNHNYVGAEHLTLVLLKKNEGSATEILTALHAKRDEIATEIIRNFDAAQTPAVAEEIVRGRKIYQKSELHETSVDPDAIIQVQRWLNDAYSAQVVEPNAMALSTVDADGQPSARIVLLRKLDADGPVFYTNYLSRKARALQHNASAGLLFYWAELERQIRIEGAVREVSEQQSDEYFTTRPRGHQLSAWASEQSDIVESRALLEERLEHYQSRFQSGEVPRPHSWGGFLLSPSKIEFWQGRPNRLHDRLLYTRQAQGWQIVRLSP